MDAFTLPAHPTLLHPRTGEPLRAIGFRPDGSPLYPIMGGDGTESDANADADADKGADKDAPPNKPDAGSGDEWSGLFAGMTPAEVKEALENSRKWESRAKGNKGKADQYDALVKAITGKDDDADADPEAIKGELTAAQREAREARVENRILRDASKHGANGIRLVDSRSFMSEIANLDPSADDFGTQVEAAIKKAVENDDYFKVAAGPRPAKQQGRPSEGSRRGSVAAVMEERAAARAAKQKQ